MEAYAISLPSRRGRTVAFRAQLPLVAKDASKAWVHFTIDGEYNGHSMGAFKFDRSTDSAIIRNFESQANAIPLTYEHPNYDDGQPKPAAGWVHQLKWQNGGLWGLCEFTQRAADMVRAGEYKYTSVVVLFDSVDRKTGEPIGAELIEVALTNRPFIDGQEPIRLSRSVRRLSMDIDIKAALKALGCDPECPPEQAAAVLMHAMMAQAAQEGKAEEPKAEAEAMAQELPPAGPMAEMAKPEADKAVCSDPMMQPPPAATPAQGPAQMAAEPGSEGDDAGKAKIVQMLEQLTGQDLAGIIAFLEQNKDKIQALAGQAPAASVGTETKTDFEDPTARMSRSDDPQALRLSALEATLSTLVTKLSAYEQADSERLARASKEAEAAKQTAVDTVLNQAIECGRINQIDREKWLKFARADLEGCKEALEKINPAVPTQKLAGRGELRPSIVLTDDERNMTKMFDDMLRPTIKDPEQRKAVALRRIEERRREAATSGE